MTTAGEVMDDATHVCPDCGTQYVKDVGRCGDLQGCSRPQVVPIPIELAEKREVLVREGEVVVTMHEAEWRALVELDADSNYAQRYLARIALDKVREALLDV